MWREIDLPSGIWLVLLWSNVIGIGDSIVII